MRVINKASLFIGFLLLFAACKKKDDGQGPEVVWTAPQEMANLYSVDTFLVQASISDEEGIHRISVNVTNASGNSLASMGDVYPNTTEYNLNEWFFLNRPDLENGDYYLNLTAYNEFNTTSLFRQINLNPIPWELRATAIAYGGNSANVAVRNEQDSGWEDVLANAGDVTHLLANHVDGSILVVSGQSGTVTALDYPDYNTSWTFEIPNNTSWRRIEAAHFNADLKELVVADTDRLVRVLNSSGGSILGFDTELEQHIPEKCLLTESRIYIIERKMDGTNQEFSEFFKTSGALNYRIYFPGDVVDMYEDFSTGSISEHNEVVLFVNDDGTARMRIFKRLEPGFDEPIDLPSGAISATCKLANREYLIQIDGTVYHYDFSGSLQIYYSGDVYKELIFDPVNNEVLGLTDAAIHYLGFQNGGLQFAGSQPVSDLNTAVQLRNR